MWDRALDLWRSAPPVLQDALWLAALLAPVALLAILATRGYRVAGLLRALLRRHLWTNLLFVALTAVSVGLGAGLLAQERAFRQGAARAADKFDLVVAAPGGETTMMLATVYLQPTDAPLLGGDVLAEILADDRVSMAAPIGFGDSWRGNPVVGTTAEFVAHLSGGLAEGRLFETTWEAVAGAKTPVALGETIEPAHGVGAAAEAHAHEGVGYRVVGRMKETGGPWDRAVVIPIEAVWRTHGLSDGHAPEAGRDHGRDQDHAADAERLGAPFDPERFPGAPAIVVRAEALWANYALRSEFTTERSMAFFPGAVLAQLHGLLGEVRSAMSVMATVSQGLVAAGVLSGLAALARLFARRLAILRAIGAPRRFVFAVIWSYAVTLIAAGSALGLGFGWAAAEILSGIMSRRIGVTLNAALGWPEIHMAAGFVAIASALALLPAAMAYRRPVVADMRAD